MTSYTSDLLEKYNFKCNQIRFHGLAQFDNHITLEQNNPSHQNAKKEISHDFILKLIIISILSYT